MDESCHLKRRREEEELELPEISSLEAKRLREDLLLDILDDNTDAGEDLASVMKILEEEIGLTSPSSPPRHQAPAAEQQQKEVAVVLEQPDLGYLLEASDDELGLPPTVPSTSSEEGGEMVEPEVGDACGAEVDGVGFDQIWGFADDINGYDGFDFVIRPEEMDPATLAPAAAWAVEEGVALDDGLFDCADMLCGPADFSDPAAWRSESLPAD